MISQKRNPHAFKKIYNLNSRQNTLPIDSDTNKYRTCGPWTLYTSSELKCKPHENPACVLVFHMWRILQMGMDRNFKKKI